MTTRLARKRPDQLSTYAAKRRSRTLTEKVILADGFNLSHGVEIARTIGEIADRCQLRSLLAKRLIEPVGVHDVRYRRRGEG